MTHHNPSLRFMLGLTLCVSIVHAGCATKTAVYSEPRAVTVTDKEQGELGQTPFLIEEQTWAWTAHELTFQKEGYETKVYTHKASISPANFVLCTVGCLATWLIWPIGLMGKYNTNKIFIEMTSQKTATISPVLSRDGGLDFKEQQRPQRGF